MHRCGGENSSQDFSKQCLFENAHNFGPKIHFIAFDIMVKISPSKKIKSCWGTIGFTYEFHRDYKNQSINVLAAKSMQV